jgi:hypothetical protein
MYGGRDLAPTPARHGIVYRNFSFGVGEYLFLSDVLRAPLVDMYLAGIVGVEHLGVMSCCRDKVSR